MLNSKVVSILLMQKCLTRFFFGQKNAHKEHEITDLKIGKKSLCFSCSEEGEAKVRSLNDLTNPLAVKNPQCVRI